MPAPTPTDPLIQSEGGETLDKSLRPSKLDFYHGQKNLKRNIKILIDAAKQRGEPLDHLLLYGPPGLGKTTLARIIGHETDAQIKITSGPALERAGDLASILTNLEDGGILFIDEIHRLHKVVEETLYPAMEDHALDIVIGRGPSARTLRLDLPKFTVVGATTRIGLMSAPIRDRFGAIFRLDFYNDADLSTIISQSAEILGVKLDAASALAIAHRSRGTPRIANRLLRRIRDYADVEHQGSINAQSITAACKLLGIDENGLNKIDYLYLETILNKFDGGPVGLDTICAAISEDRGTLEDVVEPFLIKSGFIKKTPSGRTVTSKARQLFRNENRLW